MDYRVNTPCGPLRGTAGRLPGIAAYKGIRYARAGRWEYPVQVTSWEGEYDASRYGNCCYQPRAFYDEAQAPEKAFYYREFRQGEHYDYSEDCLFLNIWTPENARIGDGLPVIVYIHGGGFTGGCGHEKHFDGPVWPLHGVIAVTINYRLGPLGFACLPQLKQEAGCTGNYGLYDQLTALQWVRDNIAAFGGSPDRVTIMGQSAGAMSVQQLCLSPLAQGLFSGAVMSSGGGVSRLLTPSAPEKHFPFWQAVMERCGCHDLAQLRAVAPERLFAAWQAAKKELKGGGRAAGPCLDGRLICAGGSELLKAGKLRAIPYLIGSTSQDVMPPMIHKMAAAWARAQADQGKRDSYCWFFDRQLPGDDCGAWHSSDLWYWFGTLSNCWRPMMPQDHALSAQMAGYLTNFAKTGDPNGDGLPRWEAMSRNQRLVNRMGEAPTHMASVHMLPLIKTMLTNKAVGE